jgi:hypothetical protein
MVSSSSGELDLIFRAILEKATRICEANFGLLFRLNNGVVQAVSGLYLAETDWHHRRDTVLIGTN